MSKEKRGPVPPGLVFIADNINAKDNILGLPASAKSRWAEGIKFESDSPTVFFAGCGYQYSDKLEPLAALVKKVDNMSLNPDMLVKLAGQPKSLGLDVAGIYSKMTSKREGGDAAVLRDAVKVLQALGIHFGYLGSHEPCCGAPLYHSGLQDEFAVNAKKAYEKLKSAGVKKIVSIVPSCTHALKTLFPTAVPEFDIEVKHFVEVVAEKIRHVELKYPRQVKVVYHDPCQLGRYMGLIEQPRHILKSISNIELLETTWTSGEWSTCCGGGGGFEVVFPDLSQTLAMGRVAELADTGADIIATHCPGCLMQLKSGVKQLKKDNLEVVDLASLIARSLPE
jgi:heterodisulfide reductase subunit B